MSQSEVRGPAADAVQAFMDNIVALARDWLPLCTPEQRKEKVSSLETQVRKLVKSLIVQEATPGIVEEVTQQVHEEIDLTTATEAEILRANETVAKNCKKNINKFESQVSEEDILEHPRYMEVMEEIMSVGGNANEVQPTEEDEESEEETEAEAVNLDSDDEDGAFAGGSQLIIPTIDPITKKKLKNPVMNRHCHHVYGKEAILQLVQQSKKVRCPAMGCQNSNFVTKKDLVQSRQLLEQFTASQKKKGQH